MVAVPAVVALNVLPDMVAPVPFAFLTLHVMVLFVALVGATVPESASDVFVVADVGTPVMPVTGTKALVTVIVKSCVYAVLEVLPFATVAVMVAVPAEVALKELPDMVAPVPFALLTLHVMVLFVALLGATVPESASDVPVVADVDTPEMPVTATNALVTVIVKSCV
jgi:hypothetical protein